MAGDDRISYALETALVRELLATWHQLNHAYFREGLAAPQIELVTTRGRLGRWIPRTRTIEMSRPLLLEQPWGVVIEVLKHEMAHQFVWEVLGAGDEAPHGPSFRDVCHRLGIDAAAAGMPEAATTAEHARVVERIAKLLALAESPNVHEAEAAMAAAQKLMLRYNLDERAHGAGKNRQYGYRQLGVPSGRVEESERLLAALLGRHFFVEAIWVPVYRPREGKRGSVLEICGTAANLEIAEYVHTYLRTTAERLWLDHKRALRIHGNRDRRVFVAGVMTGFAEKLAAKERAHKEEGLVWVKDGDLGHYFRRRHPHVRHVRHAGSRKNEAYAHGREAGRRIILHRAVAGAAASRGRLLGPGRP
jgi:predicted SprT family Zn-dependent metalloprotease